MNKIFGPSWRTSLTGYLGAVAIAILPILQAGRFPTSQDLLIAASVAVLGRFAKDHNVSGS